MIQFDASGRSLSPHKPGPRRSAIDKIVIVAFPVSTSTAASRSMVKSTFPYSYTMYFPYTVQNHTSIPTLPSTYAAGVNQKNPLFKVACFYQEAIYVSSDSSANRQMLNLGRDTRE